MKRKWTLFTFSRGDFKTLERYLNEQAERGWELEKTGILARWKRTERTDLTYCVDLAKPRQDRNERKEYADFCREGGWDLAAFTGGMYIFKSRPGAELIPIQTDPELERKQYKKYYIRNTILSVVILLAYFGICLAVGAALGGDFEGYRSELEYRQFYNWTFAVLPAAATLWGIWAAWRCVDFARVLLTGRGRVVGGSPRWVMWINNALFFVAGIGAAIFLAGFTLGTVLDNSFEAYLFGACLIWGGVMLYRALAIEEELFRHERRRHVVGGSVLILCFILLVVLRVNFRGEDWSTSQFAGKPEEGFAVYEQTFDLPLVHGEDVGIAFLPEEGETVYVSHEILPSGELWELRYVYGQKKTSHGLLSVGTQSVSCFTEAHAEYVAQALLNRYELEQHAPWPQEGLTPIHIDWADEAWCGTVVPKDGEVITALVLRVGKQVTRLIYPADLLSAENLAAIKVELEK